MPSHRGVEVLTIFARGLVISAHGSRRLGPKAHMSVRLTKD